MQECESGRRETNRRSRLAAIHAAAYDLAMIDGPSGVTIDAIADRAGVARRTFFNYFPSKEDAILGLTPLHIPDEAREAFARTPTETSLARVAHLLLAIIRTGRISDVLTTAQRRDVTTRFPDLAVRHRAHRHHAQELVLTAIEQQEAAMGEIHDDEATRRRVLVMTAGMALRLAFDRDADAVDGVTAADIDAAVARVRTIVKEL